MGCRPWGREELDTTERLHFHFSLSRIGEGNGNPLQCSCLDNPRDRGAWWAAVYGVTQSQTRLKRLSSISFLISVSDVFIDFQTRSRYQMIQSIQIQVHKLFFFIDSCMFSSEGTFLKWANPTPRSFKVVRIFLLFSHTYFI